MNTQQLYEKLAKLRDENRAAYRYANGKNEETVFVQLLALAFTNELHPDELPEMFPIRNVMFSQMSFENLMERIGLNVTVQLMCNNYATGNSFIVTQKR